MLGRKLVDLPRSFYLNLPISNGCSGEGGSAWNLDVYLTPAVKSDDVENTRKTENRYSHGKDEGDVKWENEKEKERGKNRQRKGRTNELGKGIEDGGK